MPSTEAESTASKQSSRQQSLTQVIHVVAGLIRHPKKTQQLFFTRRRPGQHLEGLWEIPGGKLQAGESRFHGLKRELREELGIEVLSARPWHTSTYHYADKTIHLDVWEVLRYSGKAHGREGQETKWLKPAQTDRYDFPPADAPVLRALTLPSRLLITPELAALDPQQVVTGYSLLMKQRRYPLTLFRSHQMDDREYFALALQLQQVASLNGAEIIIHRPSLKSLQQKRFERFRRRHLSAKLLQQLQQSDLSDSIMWSASCHTLSELQRAQSLGCRFGLLSAVRKTSSHPDADVLGWYGFSRLSRHVSLPLYALGGVRRQDLTLARYQGATGVAGIGDFWAMEQAG